MKWIPLAIMNLVLVSDIKIFFFEGKDFLVGGALFLVVACSSNCCLAGIIILYEYGRR